MILPFETTPKQKEKFEKFFALLIETNKQFDLTAITDPEEVAEKHFLDSVIIAPLIPQGASVIDIGAGAGFPSVPLKIMRQDLNLTLLDSLSKRINFLGQVKTNVIASEEPQPPAEAPAPPEHRAPAGIHSIPSCPARRRSRKTAAASPAHPARCFPARRPANRA